MSLLDDVLCFINKVGKNRQMSDICKLSYMFLNDTNTIK